MLSISRKGFRSEVVGRVNPPFSGSRGANVARPALATRASLAGGGEIDTGQNKHRGRKPQGPKLTECKAFQASDQFEDPICQDSRQQGVRLRLMG